MLSYFFFLNFGAHLFMYQGDLAAKTRNILNCGIFQKKKSSV